MVYKLCKRCKRRMYKDHLFSADYECSLTNGGLCFACEDLQHRPDISNPDGVFYCPICKVRTNEKTYNTTCVNCKGPLQRVGTQ